MRTPPLSGVKLFDRLDTGPSDFLTVPPTRPLPQQHRDPHGDLTAYN